MSGSDRFLCLTAASPFDRQFDLTSSGHGGMNARTRGEAPAVQKGMRQRSAMKTFYIHANKR